MPPPLLGRPVLPCDQPLPRGQGPPCHARPTGEGSEFKGHHVYICIIYIYIYINYVTVVVPDGNCIYLSHPRYYVRMLRV